jgi:hypothetical protein
MRKAMSALSGVAVWVALMAVPALAQNGLFTMHYPRWSGINGERHVDAGLARPMHILGSRDGVESAPWFQITLAPDIRGWDGLGWQYSKLGDVLSERMLYPQTGGLRLWAAGEQAWYGPGTSWWFRAGRLQSCQYNMESIVESFIQQAATTSCMGMDSGHAEWGWEGALSYWKGTVSGLSMSGTSPGRSRRGAENG